MFGPCALWISVVVCWHTAYSIKFPNDVIGEPVITCGQDSISISVNTTNEKASRIFAKGFHEKSECAFENTNDGKFTFTSCNMNRDRQLKPKGLSYTIVVVVQLHPQFITKVDRAYHLRCFYMEADKPVTAQLDVSMLTTESMTLNREMPTCTYSLRSGGPNGANVKFASIGDKVWHVWDCPSDIYGMLVHSCVVKDGSGNEIPILDERGCDVDRYVLATPVYNAALNSAQQETHVFKFADKLTVGFNCQIRLCLKLDAGCQDITPPSCSPNRGLILDGEDVAIPNKETDVLLPVDASDVESNNDAPVLSRPISSDRQKPQGNEQNVPQDSPQVAVKSKTEIAASKQEAKIAVVPSSSQLSPRKQSRQSENLVQQTPNLVQEDSIASEALLPVPLNKPAQPISKELENSMRELIGLSDNVAEIGSGEDPAAIEQPAELKLARDQPFLDAYFADPTSFDTRPLPSLTRRSLNIDDSLVVDVNQEMFVLEPDSSGDARFVDSLLGGEEVVSEDGVCLNTLSLILIISASLILFIICSTLLLCLILKRKQPIAASLASDSEYCFKTPTASTSLESLPQGQHALQAFYNVRMPCYPSRR